MNIVLAVTGSISAYKSYDILRSLKKKDHDVRVVLTRGALEFVKEETYHYLGASEVYSFHDDFNFDKKMGTVLHISLREWLDRLIIAPASANTISNLAHGAANDLLTTLFISILDKDILIFPAMNTDMLTHPLVQKNIETLKALNHVFIHPSSEGELACGDQGLGKLPDIEVVSEMAQNYSRLSKNYKNILITTGATLSPVDPVRYLTNPASGKTGYEIAKSYLRSGHKVTLIYGGHIKFNEMSLLHHPNLKLIKVQTTKQMYKAVDAHFKDCDVYISSAAINDIEFSSSSQKLKKDSTPNELKFNWAPDILKEMIAKKNKQLIIGFAAETKFDEALFSKKWANKPVDLLIGNIVSNGIEGSSEQGFSQDQNEYFFIKEGRVVEAEHLTKENLSHKILKFTDNFHA